MIKVINKDIGQNFYRQKCDNCAAELEFSFDDTYEGWLGARYIKCPVCGEEVMAEEIEAKALYSLSSKPKSSLELLTSDTFKRSFSISNSAIPSYLDLELSFVLF